MARWLLLALALSCAPPRALNRADALRCDVRRRVPSLQPNEIVVPFELTPEHAALAGRIAAPGRTDAEKTRLLVGALFDPAVFDVRYGLSATLTAEETLKARSGNCMGLASAFIGLARAVGLDAMYMDASSRSHETRDGGDGLTINAGHVTAIVRTDEGNIGLDFGHLGRIEWYRVLSDLEALAHFHNNRGFEIVEGRGRDADWAAAARSFELAVRLEPAFAPAWSNLGIAEERLGRPERAIEDYRRAIGADEKVAAPWNNLGSALLARGDARGAVEALEQAAEREPDGSHVLYNLAVARLRLGDVAGARKALLRAIELGAGNKDAQALYASTFSPAPPTP